MAKQARHARESHCARTAHHWLRAAAQRDRRTAEIGRHAEL